jgi:hypothetical protein
LAHHPDFVGICHYGLEPYGLFPRCAQERDQLQHVADALFDAGMPLGSLMVFRKSSSNLQDPYDHIKLLDESSHHASFLNFCTVLGWSSVVDAKWIYSRNVSMVMLNMDCESG